MNAFHYSLNFNIRTIKFGKCAYIKANKFDTFYHLVTVFILVFEIQPLKFNETSPFILYNRIKKTAGSEAQIKFQSNRSRINRNSTYHRRIVISKMKALTEMGLIFHFILLHANEASIFRENRNEFVHTPWRFNIFILLKQSTFER